MKKQHLIITALVLLLAVGLLFFINSQPKIAKHPGPTVYQKIYKLPAVGRGLPCPGETLTLDYDEDLSDHSVQMNFYACHTAKKGDLVLMQIPQNQIPTIKTVQAAEGDIFKIIEDKPSKKWKILVNKKDINYFFEVEPGPLRLYETAHKGLIQKGDVLVLSKSTPGKGDSSELGVLTTDSLLGKATYKPKPKPTDTLSKTK